MSRSRVTSSFELPQPRTANETTPQAVIVTPTKNSNKDTQTKIADERQTAYPNGSRHPILSESKSIKNKKQVRSTNAGAEATLSSKQPFKSPKTSPRRSLQLNSNPETTTLEGRNTLYVILPQDAVKTSKTYANIAKKNSMPFINLLLSSISEENRRVCNKQEIEELERNFGLLPKAYKNFLEIAGKGAGQLFVGTNIFYEKYTVVPKQGVTAAQNSIEKLQATADFILQNSGFTTLEEKRRILPENALVICTHQGYLFDFIQLHPSHNELRDDPPVFRFEEDQENAVMIAPKFSTYIAEAIENHKILLGERLNTPIPVDD